MYYKNCRASFISFPLNGSRAFSVTLDPLPTKAPLRGTRAVLGSNPRRSATIIGLGSRTKETVSTSVIGGGTPI